MCYNLSSNFDKSLQSFYHFTKSNFICLKTCQYKAKITFPVNTEMGAEQSLYNILEKILQSPKLKVVANSGNSSVNFEAGKLIKDTEPSKGSPLYILGSYLRNGFNNPSVSHLMGLTELPNWSLKNSEDRVILEELAEKYFYYINEKIGFRTFRPFKSLPSFVELPPDDWNEIQATKKNYRN